MATIEQAWPWTGFYTTAEEREAIRELRYMDGLSAPQVRRITGRCTATIHSIAPGKPGKVPNERLREAFLASPLSVGEVALSIGWVTQRHGRMSGDTSRLRRTLGLLPESKRGRNGLPCRYMRSNVDAEIVGLIAEAIGVAPWEVGCHD